MTSIRIGRIAGVDVGFNWSVLVIVALVVWSLSEQALPDAYPGHSTAAYWAAGAAIAVLFFASLLAHELAHSIVARRAGVQVREITLWMLGGMSKMKRDAPESADELRITAVGPLSSLALFVAGGFVASALALIGAPELVVIVPSMVSGLNLVLALFNLVPAFPLDGGRILRAFLWWRRGDKVWATQVAAQTGRIFGWIMVGSGVLLAASGVAVTGVWLAFIGLFIVLASTAELVQVEGQHLLAGVLVRDVMTPDPITVPATATVAELVDGYILASRVSAYPVVDGDQVLGLVTLDRARSIPPDERPTTDVTTIACPIEEVPTARPADVLLDLLPALGRSPERRALVMGDGRLLGIVSHTDVARAVEVGQLRARSTMSDGPGRSGADARPTRAHF